ncbi:membrane protein [Marinosulfonomonas sp. PRT-SC04]|nr:membrane protein [Marinosulfonomonas sp. PRT-SC04]
MTTETVQPASKVPDINTVTFAMLKAAIKAGWGDFMAYPLFGLFFGGVYFLGGVLIWYVTSTTGNTYWFMILGFGFPLMGPFLAVGLYEISRCRERGEVPTWGGVLGMAYRQKNRQFPSIIVVILFIFMIWTFAGHMIFAVFMGLSTMTNISSSYDVFLTVNGMTMLAVGSVVGAFLAGLIYAVTVMGLPLLLDRELDFVTAMIVSFQTVFQNLPVMIVWGLCIVGVLVLAMLPFFLGLLVALPVLGHATWHLYRAALSPEE